MFFKEISKKPRVVKNEYLKFGFVLSEAQTFHCPRCDHTLNAGPQYHPNYCDYCGQKINFENVQWVAEKIVEDKFNGQKKSV